MKAETKTYSDNRQTRGGSRAMLLLGWTSLGFVVTMLLAPRLKRRLSGRREDASFEMPADMQAVIPEPPSYAPA